MSGGRGWRRRRGYWDWGGRGSEGGKKEGERRVDWRNGRCRDKATGKRSFGRGLGLEVGRVWRGGTGMSGSV